MVINGKNGFVGSDGREARQQIRAALETPAKTEVAINAGPAVDGRLTIAVMIGFVQDEKTMAVVGASTADLGL